MEIKEEENEVRLSLKQLGVLGTLRAPPTNDDAPTAEVQYVELRRSPRIAGLPPAMASDDKNGKLPSASSIPLEHYMEPRTFAGQPGEDADAWLSFYQRASEQTADAGRDEAGSRPPPGYLFLLPTLPTGEDPSKQPYRIEDFRKPLEEAGVLKAVSGIGAFQMSHVWLVKFQTPEAKNTVLAKGGLRVKGGYCAIIDPCKQEITLKIHWVPFHIPGEALRKVLSEARRILRLPCRSTLQKFVGSSSGETGVTSLIRERLEVERRSLLSEKEPYCSLIVDEMTIQQKVIYDRQVDKIFGLVDVHHQVEELMKAVEEIGFRIVRIVTDNHQTNAAMFRDMSDDNTLQHVVPHPVREGDPLFLSFDPSHLIKNLRTNFLEREMTDGVEPIRGGFFLKMLFNIQKDMLVKPVRLLSRSHVEPSNLEKMKVCRATLIFSSAVVAILEFKYVLTRGLNSDPVESVFSCFRQFNGGNDRCHHKQLHFGAQVGILQAASNGNAPSSSECKTPLKGWNLATAPASPAIPDTALAVLWKLQHVMKHDVVPPTIEFAPLAYLAGYLAFICEKKVACPECKLRLKGTASRDGAYQFMSSLDEGGLAYPRPQAVWLCKLLLKDVRLDEWHVPGFECAESTTRVVRMVLKEGVTVEELPHLFKFYGGSVLVVVPGRAPTCLRCRRRGHIRRDCQTPRCTGCRAFGHVREDCARTYASVIGASPAVEDSHEHIMDADEAESTAPTKDEVSPHREPGGHLECAGKSPGEPEATDKKMTQGTVEEQERCDLAEDSEAPSKRTRKDAPTPNEGGSDRKQQRRERPLLKASSEKGNTSAMSRSASSSPVRGERRRK
ncbi:hypothetical protein HPB52_022721 [Rhipicephalus sanguineus]|uniref:CCHC-type domain-containing protein n=1 Tax=Rhipicephalus sanguineus TaxID=34632 RepID=A0A9D4Q490_RHISA|nr:hypothetical protein HPB52_022721 [Rhipicephalus sanguineus]